MTSMTTLELQERQGVWHLYLNRPEVRNALDPTMIEELTELARALATRQDVRCVVLRGRGGFFSIGRDLQSLSRDALDAGTGVDGQMAAETDDWVAQQYRQLGTLLSLLEGLPQALLAVVEGAALGGGLGLAAVADVVLARADARFGMTEARLGLVPGQIAPFVVRRIGLAASRRLWVTGRPVDGRQGQQMGLVDYCCEADADLEAALSKTLRDVLRCGPRAIAEGKALLRAALTMSDAELLDEGARVFARRARSAEGREGVERFFSGRSPDWSGEN